MNDDTPDKPYDWLPDTVPGQPCVWWNALPEEMKAGQYETFWNLNELYHQRRMLRQPIIQ